MLKIQKSIWEALRQHGEQTYPHECCGALLGAIEPDGIITVTGIARCGNTRTDSPQNRYAIDPRELMTIQRKALNTGVDIVGFYHSHPDHPARWSQTDLAEAHSTGCSYVITSVDHGRATATNSFRLSGADDDRYFEDEEMVVSDDPS
ncbi:MAG: M67 family metallopeptidase [Terriglobia bacterium]|nr:M67 family metallopeptidase [Terriglobia bacterium]